MSQSIIFLGYKKTFDHDQLGGMDSFYRRLSSILLRKGHSVQFLLYGFPVYSNIFLENNLNIIKVPTFANVMKILSSSTGTVIVNAIHRNDRLRFICYRMTNKQRKFHLVYSVFSENFVSKNLYLLETLLFPYNGIGLCLSPRLQHAVERRRNRACTFLPPIGDNFFRVPEKKNNESSRLQISFFGRIDPGKGTKKFRSIAEHFKDDNRFEFHMYGYIWPWSDVCRQEELNVQKQTYIKYHKSEHTSWSNSVEQEVINALHQTDILILPYEKLSSTADMPLLLLEGMAASCCVIIPNLGDLATVYGNSEFVLENRNFINNAISLLENAPEKIRKEKQRVHKQINKLMVDEESTYKRMIDYNII